jgi:ankyrin repeat protein
LHWASLAGQKDVVELLLAKGANVNAKDLFGKTPLDAAAENYNYEIIDLLRRHGGHK